MKQNVGKLDSRIRVFLACVAGALYVFGVVESLWLIPLGIFGMVMLATGLTSKCPGYHLLGIGTCDA